MIELYLTLASHHLSHGDFNENNPGVMINYESYIAGGYKNSFSDMSYLVAKKVNWNKGAFDYGLIVGGVTGVTPFSYVTPWIKKALEQKERDCLTVMLLPADTSVKWFKLAFDNCTECHLISGRLAFINEETGKPVSGNNKGSVVFIFDPHAPIKQAVSLIDRNEMMRHN